MKQIDQFYASVKNEMMMTLATCAEGVVTMRLVSPVEYRGSILIFTNADSKKYKQLEENPHCCVSVGGFFAQADAEFMGATMLEENAALREAYDAKFPGAFDEGLAFGGRDADFILFHPSRLSGWAFENDTPTPDGIPTIPFDIAIEAQK